jgi:hypothetical protein
VFFAELITTFLDLTLLLVPVISLSLTHSNVREIPLLVEETQ